MEDRNGPFKRWCLRAEVELNWNDGKLTPTYPIDLINLEMFAKLWSYYTNLNTAEPDQRMAQM